jgi:hypothetical protein
MDMMMPTVATVAAVLALVVIGGVVFLVMYFWGREDD